MPIEEVKEVEGEPEEAYNEDALADKKLEFELLSLEEDELLIDHAIKPVKPGVARGYMRGLFCGASGDGGVRSAAVLTAGWLHVFNSETRDEQVVDWATRMRKDHAARECEAFTRVACRRSKAVTQEAVAMLAEHCGWLTLIEFSNCPNVQLNIQCLSFLPALQTVDFTDSPGVHGNLEWLSGLTSLQGVDFIRCAGVVGDLSSLAPCKALTSINLLGCPGITGDLTSVAEFKHLARFNINGCTKVAGDISALGGLTKLTTVDTTGCDLLCGDIACLVNLKILTSVELSRCPKIIGDIACLAKLLMLTRVEMNGLPLVIGQVAHLAKLVKLVVAHFNGCRVEGSILRLAKLKKLTSVGFAGCNGLVGDVAVLANFKALAFANLRGCSALAGDVQCLAKLNEFGALDVSHCHDLTGSLQHLSKLTALTEVSFAQCGRVGGDVASICRLNQLTKLVLSGCTKVEGDVGVVLRDLKGLCYLDLGWCGQLTGDLKDLEALVQLLHLSLSHCHSINGDVAVLANMPRLNVVEMAGCPHVFGDLGVALEACAAGLTHVNFSGCGKAVGVDLQVFEASASLARLELDGCDVRGSLAHLACKSNTFAPEQAKEEDWLTANVLKPCLKQVALYSDKMWFAKPLRVAPGGGGGGCGGCLTHLSLGNGRGVTGDLSSLSGHASCLRSVNLGGCAGVAGRLASLQECAELAVLNLNGCGAVTGDVECLSRLLRLVDVNLSKCGRVCGDVGFALRSAPLLQSLLLFKCTKVVADLPQLVVGHRCLTRLDFTGCVTASTPNACPRDFDGGFNLSSGDLKLVAAWLDANPQPVRTTSAKAADAEFAAAWAAVDAAATAGGASAPSLLSPGSRREKRAEAKARKEDQRRAKKADKLAKQRDGGGRFSGSSSEIGGDDARSEAAFSVTSLALSVDSQATIPGVADEDNRVTSTGAVAAGLATPKAASTPAEHAMARAIAAAEAEAAELAAAMSVADTEGSDVAAVAVAAMSAVDAKAIDEAADADDGGYVLLESSLGGCFLAMNFEAYKAPLPVRSMQLDADGIPVKGMLWKLMPDGSILNKWTGLVLQTVMDSTDRKAVCVCDDPDVNPDGSLGTTCVWTYNKDGSLKNASNGYLLTVAGGSTKSRTEVWLNARPPKLIGGATRAMKWKLTPYSGQPKDPLYAVNPAVAHFLLPPAQRTAKLVGDTAARSQAEAAAIAVPDAALELNANNDPTAADWHGFALLESHLGGCFLAMNFETYKAPLPVRSMQLDADGIPVKGMLWKLMPDGSILNRWTGLVLQTVMDSTDRKAACVCDDPDLDLAGQLGTTCVWTYNKDGSLENASNGYLLTVAGGSTKSRTEVWLNARPPKLIGGATKAMKWKFTPWAGEPKDPLYAVNPAVAHYMLPPSERRAAAKQTEVHEGATDQAAADAVARAAPVDGFAEKAAADDANVATVAKEEAQAKTSDLKAKRVAARNDPEATAPLNISDGDSSISSISRNSSAAHAPDDGPDAPKELEELEEWEKKAKGGYPTHFTEATLRLEAQAEASAGGREVNQSSSRTLSSLPRSQERTQSSASAAPPLLLRTPSRDNSASSVSSRASASSATSMGSSARRRPQRKPPGTRSMSSSRSVSRVASRGATPARVENV